MMKWMTRIPTHDNEGELFDASIQQSILEEVRRLFGGFSFDGPGWGAWTDDKGQVYEEHSFILSVLCDRRDYLHARRLVIEIGRRLAQKAMYFEVRDVDGVEILQIDGD